MMKKVKAFFGKVGKKGKAFVASAVAMMSAVSMAAIASADEVTSAVDPATSDVSGFDMQTTLTAAGEQLVDQFGILVGTLIPVIIGILTSALVVFGIFALIKLAKKIFGKVAG